MILFAVNEVLIPIALLSAIGGLFGVLIAILSKVFAVKVDERMEKIAAMLPGANCGMCGFPGCKGLAEGIVSGKATASLCKPGKQDMRDRIKAYLEDYEKNNAEK